MESFTRNGPGTFVPMFLVDNRRRADYPSVVAEVVTEVRPMNATALRASADAHLSEVYARLESASRAYYRATDRFGPCSDETVPARNRLRAAWKAMYSAKIAVASTTRGGAKS